MGRRDPRTERPVDYSVRGTRRRRGSRLLLLLAALLVVFLALPFLRDSMDGPCVALEARIVAIYQTGEVPFVNLGPDIRALAGSLSWKRPGDALDGSLASRHVTARQPYLPDWMGCYWRYWRVTVGR